MRPHYHTHACEESVLRGHDDVIPVRVRSLRHAREMRLRATYLPTRRRLSRPGARRTVKPWLAQDASTHDLRHKITRLFCRVRARHRLNTGPVHNGVQSRVDDRRRNEAGCNIAVRLSLKTGDAGPTDAVTAFNVIPLISLAKPKYSRNMPRTFP